jgi:hypothetical protein
VHDCKPLSNVSDVDGDVEIEQKTTQVCRFVSSFSGWSFAGFLLDQKILSLLNA